MIYDQSVINQFVKEFKKKDNQKLLQGTMERVEKFYKGLTDILQYGTPWQKKMALGYAQEFKDGLKRKMEMYCKEQGISMRSVEQFLALPQFQSALHVQELKERIAVLDENLLAAAKRGQGAVKVNNKPSKHKRTKRKMEKRIQASI